MLYGCCRQTLTSNSHAVEAGMIETLDNTFRNFRRALRSLARRPGFALASLLSLALGIGANIALFSVAYGVLLRPLPFQRRQRRK